MDEKRRRKSLSIFRPSSLTSLTPIHDGAIPDSAPPATLKKKARPASFFTSSVPPSPSSPASDGKPASPMFRPRSLVKSRASVFGSYRSLHSLQGEDDSLSRTLSNPLSIDEHEAITGAENMTLLHHGEVQLAGGMFRKKSQYLVLTDSHLLRFKSQAKAADSFATISSAPRELNVRHSRLSSNSSFRATASSSDHSAIALSDIVAVYKLDDGRPYFTIEIAYLDISGDPSSASTLSLQISDPAESDLWLASIREAKHAVFATETMPFTRSIIEYIARAVEMEKDYDPSHFRIFKVVQRANKAGARSSSDDLTKLMSSICYLVIGFQKIHLLPLARSKTGSSTSLADLKSGSFGIASLNSVYVQPSDDAFQLSFRIPLQKSSTLYLASSCVEDIALCVRQSAEFLRPNWLELPFVWSVPHGIDEAQLSASSPEEEEHLCFERTLTAYCVSYEVDPSNIRYTIDYYCEDAPEFCLLSPHSRRAKYTSLELLAVLRSLRYNESFHSISFQDVKLDALYGLVDKNGSEHMIWTSRSGHPLSLPQTEHSELLVQEVQSLALKSQRLRRFNFTNCLSRRPRSDEADRGSGLCEALFPLCAAQLTNIDWIILRGIALAESDLDYIYAAAIKRSSHLRAVDLGSCGLTDESLKQVLQALVNQDDSLESVDLSGNPARLDPNILDLSLSRFPHLRFLDLSRIHRTSSANALLPPEVLLKLRLERLNLSGTLLNSETVDSLAAYLLSEQSNGLKDLQLNQCHISGADVATLLLSTGSRRNFARSMHFSISENRLEDGHQMMVNALRRTVAPTRITMQLLEYTKEENFQALLASLATNTSTVSLDISRTFLPYDAGKDTCDQLRRLFEENSTLEELDISGEQAHLEAVTLGKGLGDALEGLTSNKRLRVLRIENQAFGLEGANALANVLEKNSSLQEVHCDGNEINLQAFTMLVDAIKNNKTLLYLPNMDKDRAWSRQKIDREISSIRETSSPSWSGSASRSSVRRAISGAITNKSTYTVRGALDRTASASFQGYTEQDVLAAITGLEQRWSDVAARLHSYLRRNYCLAHGLPLDDADEATQITTASRPPTAASLVTALRNARLDRTPTAELDLQLGDGLGLMDEELYRLVDGDIDADADEAVSPISPQTDDATLELGFRRDWHGDESLMMTAILQSSSHSTC